MRATTGSGGNRDTAFAVEVDHAFVVVPKNIPVKRSAFGAFQSIPFFSLLYQNPLEKCSVLNHHKTVLKTFCIIR